MRYEEALFQVDRVQRSLNVLKVLEPTKPLPANFDEGQYAAAVESSHNETWKLLVILAKVHFMQPDMGRNDLLIGMQRLLREIRD